LHIDNVRKFTVNNPLVITIGTNSFSRNVQQFHISNLPLKLNDIYITWYILTTYEITMTIPTGYATDVVAAPP